MTNYGIYRWTNQINDKVYIGLSVDPKSRKYSHIQAAKRGSTFPFHLALMKYGVENFTFEVIFTVFNKDDLGEFERHFIKEHNCCRLDGDVLGYNLTRGGEGFDSETARNIIKKRTAEGTNPWAGELGSKHSTELAKRLKAEGRHCSQDPQWVKDRGDEARARVQDGTHHWLGEEWSKKVSERNKKLIEKGMHPWQTKEYRERFRASIESGDHYFTQTRTCIHCGISATLTNIKKWHDDNCTKNPNFDPAGRNDAINKMKDAVKRNKANGTHWTALPDKQCPHCGIFGKGPNMTRYHFDKCKQKK